MSGSGSAKRQRLTTIRIAKLAADGLTHKQIAEIVGIDPKKVKARIILGQRLKDQP